METLLRVCSAIGHHQVMIRGIPKEGWKLTMFPKYIPDLRSRDDQRNP